jgi:2-iminobutanoate/2-iminopropanoate deaminase
VKTTPQSYIEREKNMQKKVMNPGTIAPPISNYSHVARIEVADTAFIYVAGQVALDPTGKLVGENDIGAQTEFIFRQLETILQEVGGSLKDVFKANIFVTDMSQFETVAAIRNRYFAVDPPISTFVEVSKLVREGLLIEIEVQAAVQL